MAHLRYTPSNDRLIFNIKVMFVLLFIISIFGVIYYQDHWVKPGKECEKQGRWWSAMTRECGIPIKISDITGRHMEDPAPVAQPVAPALQSMPAMAAPAAAAKTQ
jgi:hypothetical protein